MSDNIFEPLGNALSECVKSANTTIDKDGEGDLAPYISGILGGTLISFFSPPMGVPLMVLGTVGGIVDVLYLSKKNTEEENEEEPDLSDFDIFKCIGLKNSLGVYPEFKYMTTDGGYVYSRPEGITLNDIKKYKEEINLALNIANLEVVLLDKNKSILLREYVDKIGSKQSYENRERDKNKLIAYVGVFLNKEGVLEPLPLNFTKNNHVMVASTSGWGKSSLLRTLIVDLMLNYSYKELEFYFIDMKMTELVLFEDYKHCVGECITEHKDIVPLLEKLKAELVRRKRIMKEAKLNDIYQYNMLHKDNKLTYKVVVIDELYEVVVGKTDDHKKINALLALLLSQARAFGMYFVLSTQHPSRKLIDASIQSNVAQRIGLKVQSETDSDVVFPGARLPLQDIAFKGRGYYGGIDGSYTEFQSYYIGDPELKNEPEEIAKLLKPYKKKRERGLKSIMDNLKSKGVKKE